MSHNHDVTPTSPSRRSVVKGAAWAVPAVAVAAAAPTVAASQGPLTFEGSACKLPGNANDLFKGYVFELIATNALGPNPITGVTVISDVKIDGVSVKFQVVVRSGSTCTCPGFTAPGSNACNTFCTPDGAVQHVYVYVFTQPSSQNATFSLSYQRYECSTGVAIDASPVPIQAALATPPATGPDSGNCTIPGASTTSDLSAGCAA